LDEYLDGALSPDERAAVEAALRADAAAARRLELMQRERALRGAALAGYAPSSDEAEAAAVRIIAAMEDEAAAPVARIGPRRWIRYAGAVAAAVVVLAGAFAAGRMTAPVQIENRIAEGPTKYSVIYTDDQGETKTKAFDSELPAMAFMAERVQQAGTPGRQAVASIDEQGMW
jgi:anti-sigma-K factor RskA